MLKKVLQKIAGKSLQSYSKMFKNPAGERNKQPILDVLRNYIDADKENNFMEISSGCGLHMSHMAPHFPKTTFLPSEYDTRMFQSIIEYTKNCENVMDPVFVDISQKLDLWNTSFKGMNLKNCLNTFDYMLNINMIHISPFKCTEGLFENCSKLLKSKGLLFTYGPYSLNNVLTPESNVLFNESLKRQNSEWGIRDIADLKLLADRHNMELIKIHDLPANNKLLVWIKK